MDRIRIVGGNELRGTIPISGAKNAALPLMIASLLTDETLTLENVPHLADVEQLIRILGNHGVDYSVNGRRETQNSTYARTINFTAKNIVTTTAPYELVSKMRASFWVIGPLLARMGEAKVSLPGGCAIGTRPVDLFIEGLQQLGAQIDVESGYVIAKTNGRLTGNRYVFPKVSVGATHVLMMAATLARGETVLENAAREPEVVDLADCLIAMGARISGAGTSTITIDGVDQPRRRGASGHPRPHRDRHLCDGGRHGGRRRHSRRRPHRAAGDGARRHPPHRRRDPDGRIPAFASAATAAASRRSTSPREPFPGFPTDLQAQFMGLMTMANGKSKITETIFENRFMHVQELARLGAHINLSGQTAIVEGVSKLKGAPVMATDLRASVSLVIAGLAAEGETTVSRVYHLDRGFERLEEKLSGCGAVIERITG